MENRQITDNMTASDPFANTKATDKPVYSSTSSTETIVTVDEYYHHIFGCIKLRQLDRITIFVAEIVGTAILLLVGCSSAIIWKAEPGSHVVGLVFGFTVATIVQSIGSISGAHLNPAVTAAAVIYKIVSIQMAAVYIIAQTIGAIMGFGLLVLLTPSAVLHADRNSGLCTTVPQEDMTIAQTFFIEYFATMILIIAVCSVWDPRNAKNQDSVAIKFALIVGVLSISFGPFTGCSMNPVRTLAPAIFNNNYSMHWVYWLAPMSSGILTTIFYKAFMWRDVPQER